MTRMVGLQVRKSGAWRSVSFRALLVATPLVLFAVVPRGNDVRPSFAERDLSERFRMSVPGGWIREEGYDGWTVAFRRDRSSASGGAVIWQEADGPVLRVRIVPTDAFGATNPVTAYWYHVEAQPPLFEQQPRTAYLDGYLAARHDFQCGSSRCLAVIGEAKQLFVSITLTARNRLEIVAHARIFARAVDSFRLVR